MPSGTRPSESLHRTIELASHAERLGYERFWVAEHHSLPSVSSSSPDGHDGGRGGSHEPHPGRLRRHHAPQPRSLEGGGDLPRARGAAPRPDRPGHRPGAGHRPADRVRVAAQPGSPDGGRLPAAVRRARRLRRRLPRRSTRSPRSPPCRTTSRCRRCGSWVPASTAVEPPPRSAPGSRSPATSAASTRPRPWTATGPVRAVDERRLHHRATGHARRGRDRGRDGAARPELPWRTPCPWRCCARADPARCRAPRRPPRTTGRRRSARSPTRHAVRLRRDADQVAEDLQRRAAHATADELIVTSHSTTRPSGSVPTSCWPTPGVCPSDWRPEPAGGVDPGRATGSPGDGGGQHVERLGEQRRRR